MKTNISVITYMMISFFFFGCEKEELAIQKELPPSNGTETPAILPEGYFEVTFSPGGSNETRAAVTGPDGRVQYLRYLIYDSTGVFVKEKVVLTSSSGTASWPLPAMKDTLPRAKYTAVFLGNVEKTLFPFTVTGGGQSTADVLLNYQGQMSDARIILPNGQFTDKSEYYWAKVPFSDTSNHPTILLQRIIGQFKVHRNFVDADTALNKLTQNVVTSINAKNIIKNQVDATLPSAVRTALDLPVLSLVWNTLIVGGLNAAVDTVTHALVTPVTNALYDQLVNNIVNQLGNALEGNASHEGAIEGLGALLNPWNNATAHTAVVTIRDFPKTMDFNLTVKEFYSGDHNFQYNFTTTSNYSEKDILIKGLHGLFNVRKIRVSQNTLIGGLLVDNVTDGMLLNGTFVNITDTVNANVDTNRRYKADYSFLDLGYTQGTATQPLILSVKVNNIANIDGLLAVIPIIGPLLNGVLNVIIAPLKSITITVPINVPILGADKLTLSGSWSPVTPYN